MTVDELCTEVARKIELGHEYIMLVLPGERTGLRARVIPGVMAQVMCVNAEGNTVVSCPLAPLARVLALHKAVGL